MNMKRFLWGFIVIAAVALVGCGGNGGTSLMIGDERATQEGINTLLSQLSDANAEVERLTAALEAAPTQAEADALNRQLTEARNQVTRLNAQIIALTPPSEPAPNPMSEGIEAAIMKASMTADSRPAASTITATEGNSQTDVTAKIRVGGAAGSDILIESAMPKVEMTTDDPPTPVAGNFMPKSGSEMSLGKGFTGMVHEKTADGVTDAITLITDMEEPGDSSFALYYGHARDGVDGTLQGDPDADDPAYHLVIAEIDQNTSDADLDAARELLSASALPFRESQTFDYLENKDTGDDNRTFEGTFNKVDGTYACQDECQAKTDKDGNLSALTGTWHFTPKGDVSKIMIPDVDQDSDFLAFGYWLKTTTEDDETSYTLSTFATSSRLYHFAAARRTNVRGTATYSGPAAGQYARKTLTPDAQVQTLRVGEFTAQASLTAVFGQTTDADAVGAGTIPPNLVYSISGTVTDFKDENDAMLDSTWMVDLKKAGFGQVGVDDNPVKDGLPASTFGGATTGDGEWQGQFSGVILDRSVEVAPSGVVGEFTASFVNGEVAGAFGATQ